MSRSDIIRNLIKIVDEVGLNSVKMKCEEKIAQHLQRSINKLKDVGSCISPNGRLDKIETGDNSSLFPRLYNEIMTIKDVAKFLILHPLTVYRLVQEGKIPAFKVGRQWRNKKGMAR